MGDPGLNPTLAFKFCVLSVVPEAPALKALTITEPELHHLFLLPVNSDQEEGSKERRKGQSWTISAQFTNLLRDRHGEGVPFKSFIWSINLGWK